ncbi:MAG: hypothetical protein IPM79_23455 [Polyangiaceae bacterium]|jgi:hypothetical protein|nr:hypothetical protein [Polyangiaceae bacterium]MBK8940488.1 hypothetical protein [Polyangiaceae bacterium]
MNRAFSFGLVVAGLALGCGDDTTATGGSGGSGGGGGESAGGSPATGGGGAGLGGTPSTGGNGTGGDPGTGGNGTGGAAASCVDDVNDTACVACAKDSCCDAYAACEGDAGCVQCITCTQTAADPTTCLGTDCDLSDVVVADMIACANGSCNADCFGGQSLCEPSNQDTPCLTCVKGASNAGGCCTELEACSADPECIQCLACVQSAADPTACLGNGCALADAETSDFLSCALNSCGDECQGG